LTLLAGCLANVKNQHIKTILIRAFIKAYGIDMREAQRENPEDYVCFNDFFIRHLKADCRPLAVADVISPVDGFVSQIGGIKDGQILQAKGHYYTVNQLLGIDTDEARLFSNGHFATLYLSPKDYHRVHMPMDATLVSVTYIPGALFSVQPATVKTISGLFARNERLVVLFETSAGLMAMVLVGATIVGAIGTSWQGEIKRAHCKDESRQFAGLKFKQGDEMGYFRLGSTVILLFANNGNKTMEWLPHWQVGNKINFGMALGRFDSIFAQSGINKA
jgi:phosphatidylserine decarboxylase